MLGAFVAFNLSKAWVLRGGKAAPSEVGASCCRNFPAPLRGVTGWWYERIGNPFQYPANLAFSLRHDVELQRWDAVGAYPLVPPLHTLPTPELWQQRGTWRIGNPGIEPWLAGGMSRPDRVGKLGRWYRFTTGGAATVLVPNLMPYGQRLTLWVAPFGGRNVRLRWNGEVVAEAALTGWTPVQFDLPDIALHTNELTIEGYGIAVSDLELQFLVPE
ncbi:MAG: hypothetical protein WKG01_21160 [Kofleriaceae bacterium]